MSDVLLEQLEALSAAVDDADDRVCHLCDEAEPGVPACGARSPSHHPGIGPPFRGECDCPVCGRPTCPDCMLVFEIFARTGEWEGV